MMSSTADLPSSDTPEALEQVAIGDAIVLTKSDLAKDPATLRDLAADREQLKAINPAAQILDRHRDWQEIRSLVLSPGTYDLRTKGEDALAWLKADAILESGDDVHKHGDHRRHGDAIHADAIVIDKPIHPLIFNFFLDTLKISAGPDLLRIKGLFALSDDPGRPVVVHGVQHLIHPIDRLEQWPSDDRRTRMVVIGRNLDIGAMRAILTSGKPRPAVSCQSTSI